MGANELRYGSLFSGIGGIDLGMDMAGFECAWQVEIDDYCREILKAQWPNSKRYRDIFKVKGEELEPVDILCGGFPCQPVSLAGKRSGVDDERWLWDEFYRLICDLRPRWVVAENVPGLLSANSGRAFAGVLRDLAKSGYDVVWDVFPAGGPGGVGAPHKRARVFIVGYSKHNGSLRSGNIRSLQAESQRKESKIKQSSRTSSVKMADTDSSGQQKSRNGKSIQKNRKKSKHRSGDARNVANTDKKRLQRSKKTRDVKSKGQDREEYVTRCNKGAEQWFVEPDVGRVANGIPRRVDRLRALGNAVVPQVAYKVARMIYEYTEKEK